MAFISRQIIYLLVLGFSYGVAISYSNETSSIWIDNLASLVFVAITIFIVFGIYSRARCEVISNQALVALGMSPPMGIFLACALLGSIERHFWVSDAVLTHAPSAEFFLLILKQSVPFDETAREAIFKPGAVTHGWVALWYLFFGISPVVETFSLLVLKALTLLLIAWTGPLMWSWLGVMRSDRGRSAVLLYVVAPSVLFHTMAFYKEAAVHLFVAGLMFGVMRSALRPSWLSATIVLASILGLLVERFYLAAVFVPILIWLAWLSLKSWKILPSALFAVTIAGVFFFRREAGNSIAEAVEFIKDLRTHHASFKEISYRFNYEIPYIVAFLKTIMTPIWSPDKLSFFKGASALITWGSFVHQLTMMFYLAALAHIAYAKKLRPNLYMQIPFLFFVLVAAYVSPWAGRIRDSFYPFLVLFASYYLNEHFPNDIARLKTKLRTL